MGEITQKSVLEFIINAHKPVTRREMARAFGLKDAAKIALKKHLKNLQGEGLIERLPSKAFIARDPDAKNDGDQSSVMILRIIEVTLDGDLYGQPVAEEDTQNTPEKILIETPEKHRNAPGEGDRVLCQMKYYKNGDARARIIRKLGSVRDKLILGRAVKSGATWWLQPVDKRERDDLMLAVPTEQQDTLEPGALVEGLVEEGRALKRPRARLHAIIGHDDDPRAISLIAMHEQGLRTEFSDDVIKETDKMSVPDLGKREDLRVYPLVTIDGADARDFDDAVFATKVDDGFHLIVAIADVAHYVRSDGPLDQEAYKRGNSTYFPDRVLPMLPEKLSNDLCSLRPKENRACLAVHMWIDADGHLKKHKFVRGLMKSAARLTYEQVQEAFAGKTDDTTDPLLNDVLKPLYAAYKVLDAARIKRGALDLDLPERQILVNEKGDMTGVTKRARYDSHKLIEEFMVLANVAAAEALEAKQASCIYRIHDTPSTEKVDAARNFLEGFGLNLARGQVTQPSMFNNLLKKVEGKEFAPLVSEIVLRSQSRAVYSDENIGHFGLALKKYAHFTSPIRRYADLVVHRSLIRAYGLGDGGLDAGEETRLSETADHITKTERASMEAERSSVDRFTAAWLMGRMGEDLAGRISGVTRFGLFVSLDETGADGLVPIRSLPGDYYIHSEEHHALIGRRTGRLFRLCAPVRVRVVEADRLTGSSIFELVNPENGAEVPGYKSARPLPVSKERDNRRGRRKIGHKKTGKKPYKNKGKKKP